MFLTEAEMAAWRELLTYLPRVAITQSERVGLAQMAKVWVAVREMDPLDDKFKKLDDSLRQWCMQFGMTLLSRIKMGTGGQNTKPQKFEQLRDPKSA